MCNLGGHKTPLLEFSGHNRSYLIGGSGCFLILAHKAAARGGIGLGDRVGRFSIRVC